MPVRAKRWTPSGDSINDLVQFGLPDDYYDTYGGQGARAEDEPTSADGRRRPIVHPDNLIWVIVGDRAKIEAGIKELGLGEIRLLDADGKPI